VERLERETRRLRTPRHELINQLAEQAGPEELGARLSHALADRQRITRGEASRGVAEAAELGPRRRLTGEVPAPRLTATAAAQRAGDIGTGDVAVIRRFVNQLPSPVDLDTPGRAEQHLAELARGFRPDQLADAADVMTDCVNPDGTYTDEDRARRRGLNPGQARPRRDAAA
jgi:hypothetical protein